MVRLFFAVFHERTEVVRVACAGVGELTVGDVRPVQF